MSIIDRELVKKINSGSCFVLIGSGASCELGLPDWKGLCENVFNAFLSEIKEPTLKKCKDLIRKGKYLEFLLEIQNCIEKNRILQFIETIFSTKGKQGRVYSHLIEWPFASYLTTNFDNAIEEHANRNNLTLITKRNSKDDLVHLRASSKDLIFKIHGDFTDPSNVVLDKKDYDEFIKAEQRNYWREKISSTLHMVDLLIVGYSAKDPDFIEQLERAKQIANQDHPIFMIATGFTNEDIKNYFLNYNIRIISYQNRSGKHTELIKLLDRYNPFIAKRGSSHIGVEHVKTEESERAASMYLFAQLRIKDDNELYVIKVYSAYLMQLINANFSETVFTHDELITCIEKEKYFQKTVDPHVFQESLKYLHSINYIDAASSTLFRITALGKSSQAQIVNERQLLNEKFIKSCKLFLTDNFSDLTTAEIDSVVAKLIEGLSSAFRKRGLEIARKIHLNDVVDFSDSHDILDIINAYANDLPQNNRLAFVDLMIEILVASNEHMKNYLAALTQGYFSYHILGLDGGCYEERLALARTNQWIIDSSILLPFLAIDCPNFDYARDLLSKLTELKLECYTTELLLTEVIEHANWAINNYFRLEANPAELLQVALGQGGAKQDLFISGYIKWSQTKANPTFDSYMEACIGTFSTKNVEKKLREHLALSNIEIKDFDKIPELTEELINKRHDLAKEIEIIRKRYDTYRSDSQCLAESEVIIFNELKKSIFISQSIHLNNIGKEKSVITWTPEAVYRFLTLFSSHTPTNDYFHECLTQSFFFSGLSIFDKQVLTKFASPLIRQSRMELEQERGNYENLLEAKKFDTSLEDLEKQPDLNKPFYSLQTAFYYTRLYSKQTVILADRIDLLQKNNKLSNQERDEYIKLKTKAEMKKTKQKRKNKSRNSQKKKKKRK